MEKQQLSDMDDRVRITVELFEADQQEIENKICKLLDYGNVPEENFDKAFDLLTERKFIARIIYEFKNL